MITMKVLELYSGIGGMHFALKESTIGKTSEVVMAVEINPVCNDVYKHNFPNTKLWNRNIGSLNVSEINTLKPDLVLMSPPCQPFTRLGKQKDIEDTRNVSLLQFIELIPQLTTVSFLLLENVKGFEVSETRQRLITSLRAANYIFEEFLLNPRQLEICNSRLRYYLLAKRTSQTNESLRSDIICDVPSAYETYFKTRLRLHIPLKIEEILEYNCPSADWNSYSIPFETVNKYLTVLDIVSREDKNSCCFTKGYSRYLEGTGSVLTNLSKTELNSLRSVFKSDFYQDNAIYNQTNIAQKLNLRYFTPIEIARLMMFPSEFKFPNHISRKQRYKMLSNSINIYVVSFLISYLTECFNHSNV